MVNGGIQLYHTIEDVEEKLSRTVNMYKVLCILQ